MIDVDVKEFLESFKVVAEGKTPYETIAHSVSGTNEAHGPIQTINAADETLKRIIDEIILEKHKDMKSINSFRSPTDDFGFSRVEVYMNSSGLYGIGFNITGKIPRTVTFYERTNIDGLHKTIIRTLADYQTINEALSERKMTKGFSRRIMD